MRNLFWALVMSVPMCLGSHGNLLATGEGASFGDIKKQVGEPLHMRERHHIWRRVEYRNRIENQLFDLSKQVHELTERAKMVKHGFPAELGAKIASLKDREAIVKEKLTELRSSTSRDWHQVKSELDKALDDLKVALDSARFQFMGFGN